VLVNAAGPWVGSVAETVIRVPGPSHLRLVKGSHIVVPRLFDHDRGYILQSSDSRVVFVLPFGRDFSLIGTTDEDFAGDPAAVAPTPDEILYLCQSVNSYFRHSIGVEDIKWAFSGVRSLYDDGSKKPEHVTRDYHLALDERFREAPVLTIYGGKITTYRRLAEAVLARLAHFFQPRPGWTFKVPLPGGDFPHDQLEKRVAQARQTWPFLAEDHARRLVGAYGTRIDRILGAAKSLDDLGTSFGVDLTEAEVRYLMRHEWAQTADDVLWRRSKLGIHFSAEQREGLARFMAAAEAGEANR
jgi:glycerol-3-phosphate dehydrogenase